MLKPQVIWNLPDGSSRRIARRPRHPHERRLDIFQRQRNIRRPTRTRRCAVVANKRAGHAGIRRNAAQIKSEIKISSYQNFRRHAQGGHSARRKFLIICGCIRICPARIQRWLFTKFHGRLAAPWTCLVVVLIAIPFGAATGRQESFFRRRGQHFHLLQFFCDSTSQPRAWFRAAICPRGWRRGCRIWFLARRV